LNRLILKRRIFALALLAILFGSASVHASESPFTDDSSILNDPEWRKRFLGSYGFLSGAEPEIRPDELETLREVIDLTKAMGISGVPVVHGKETLGIVTGRDLRFETNLDKPVTSVMTPKDRLVTVREGADRDEVIALLHKHRIERVLVINGGFKLRGMITVKDIQKSTDYPHACKDDQGRLRVGAAVGTSTENEQRIASLVEADVDVIVVDTAHGHSQGVLDRVRWIKRHYPDVQVIGGNIATAAAARALFKPE
jgi:IMP dehydrogenase